MALTTSTPIDTFYRVRDYSMKLAQSILIWSNDNDPATIPSIDAAANSVVAVIAGFTVPAIPTITSVNSAFGDSLAVSMTANATGGSAITFYDVFAFDRFGKQVASYTSNSSVGLIITGLKVGESYTVKGRVRNVVGPSDMAGPTSPVTIVP